MARELVPKLPSVEEIAGLPCWAMVALAVMCARRARPCLGESWPDAPTAHLDALISATTLAEQAACSGNGDVPALNSAVERAWEAEKQAKQLGKITSGEAACAAGRAAFVARIAADSAMLVGNPTAALKSMAEIVHEASTAMETAASGYLTSREHFIAGVRKDYERLKEYAATNKATQGTPIPAVFFQPH